MNRAWMAVAALPLAALSLPLASARASQDQQGRLQRVAPLADGPGAATAVQVEAEDFDASEWLARLSDADLVARERSFDAIVELARRDGRARDWLQERVADSAASELGWTARLALRELDRRDAPDFLRGRMGLRNGDPFGDLRAHIERLRQQMGQPLDPSGSPLPPLGAGRAHATFGGVSIEETPNGVKVVVTEMVDGQETRREYEAQSMDELLEAHPELQESIGSGIRVFHFPLGADPLRDVGGMRLELERLLEGLDHLDRTSPPGDPTNAQPIRTDVLGVYSAVPSEAVARKLGLAPGTGVAVHGTVPGTIAHVLGIGPGCVITEINGHELHSVEQIGELIRARPSEGEVTVVWFDRSGEQRRQTWMPAKPGSEAAQAQATE